jgi:F0F1-type ATP synthase assembly protein I
MLNKLLNSFTNFGLAGISSLVIAVGDLIWLMKDAFQLPHFVYGIISVFLITGIIIALLSILRHAEQHAKRVKHKKHIL